MSIVITFYNHKGGVSKTTTTFNLAHLLAEKNYKILVIDADPQCNMIEIMLSALINELDEEEIRTGIEKEIPGTSLLDILKPRIEGSIPQIDVESVKVVKINDNLDLIRGDVAISSIEDALSEAHSQRFSSKTHEKRTYVAIGDFFNRFGAKYGYHYILLDVGPSSGALTRSCFLACDAFFVPVSPDRFNVQAISTLSAIISRWLLEHSQIYEDFMKIGLPVKHGLPLFLGTVSQHFKIIRGRPKLGYKLWMDRMPQSVEKNLLPVLERFSSTSRDLTSGLSLENISVTEIPDFGSLAPLMQEYGKAVFQIQQKDTSIITESGGPWTGATWKDAQERMRQFRSKFEEIEERLVAICK